MFICILLHLFRLSPGTDQGRVRLCTLRPPSRPAVVSPEATSNSFLWRKVAFLPIVPWYCCPSRVHRVRFGDAQANHDEPSGEHGLALEEIRSCLWPHGLVKFGAACRHEFFSLFGSGGQRSSERIVGYVWRNLSPFEGARHGERLRLLGNGGKGSPHKRSRRQQ
jgi:hypothetical protein